MMKLISSVIVGLIVVVAVGLALTPGIHISSLPMMLNVVTGSGADTDDVTLKKGLKLSEGYSISIYARGISNPRMMWQVGNGHLLVSSPRSGEIVQIIDSNGDGIADKQMVLLDGLNRPHGLEVHKGYLYVGESNQVGRIQYDALTGQVSGEYQTIVKDLTDEGGHWTKNIRFSEDGWLYLAQGSTCNVCDEKDRRRATIMRFRADGSEGEIFATGLRNSIGLAFAPWNGALYATDNGRDLLGDDYPPCELNLIERDNFYGWPYLNGDNELDPDMGMDKEALQATAKKPAFNFPAHNAPLGIHFSKQQERTALVALHGSWNRSEPDGYKMVALKWQEDGSISSSDFIWGFLEGGKIIGRPVDIVSDGADGYFLSDDYARVIYRISPSVKNTGDQSLLVQAEKIESVPIKADAELAQQGENIYQAYGCHSCHNPALAAGVLLENLNARYSLQTLAEFFITPTPPMPRFDFSEQQREQLVHYLMSDISD